MNKVVHRMFFAWDYEKEEKWLNKMSAKGWQLCDVGLFRYAFNEGQPGEYIYRMELFGNRALKNDHARYIRYIQFVEDTGAEHIGSTLNWMYFRKKAGAAGFGLFSDIDSRIQHFNRINYLLVTLSIMCIINGINNMSLWYRDQIYGAEFDANLVVGIICLAAAILLGYGAAIIYSKIRKLKKEKLLHE